jgi:peptidyl-tRNA hydrolase
MSQKIPLKMKKNNENTLFVLWLHERIAKTKISVEDADQLIDDYCHEKKGEIFQAKIADIINTERAAWILPS